MYPSCHKNQGGENDMIIVLNVLKCVWILVLITHRYEDVKTPNTRHQVEHTQLTRLIELGVLALGEVEAPDDFLQHNNRSCERLLFQPCHCHTHTHEGVSQTQ